MNKPIGVTSFQSLGQVKRHFETRRVGHTGTLDKFAHGLMIVLVGKLTKLNPLFTGMDKVYEGVIRFGEETDTLDPEGVVLHSAAIPELSDIEKVLSQFLGQQDQIPPLYSAIHVNGKRSWKLARQGVEVEMKPRPVRIDTLEILSWDSPDLTVRVACSSGTYIRSLARDIALACDSRAHLVQLIRTSVGQFDLKDSYTMGDDFTEKEGEGIKLLDLYGIIDRLPVNEKIILDQEKTEKVRLGIPPQNFFTAEEIDKEGLYPLFDGNKNFAALLERKDKKLTYRFVM